MRNKIQLNCKAIYFVVLQHMTIFYSPTLVAQQKRKKIDEN